MRTGVKLGLFGAALVVAFGGAFVASGAIVPDEVAEAWTPSSDSHASHNDEAAEAQVADSAASVPGVTIESAGYILSPVAAPTETNEEGTLSFQILGEGAVPITTFDVAHEKQLHLIVVRTDGTEYRHAHPELDERTGTWSLPWSWEQAGTYRIYADFAVTGGEAVTLSRAFDVAGEFLPQPPTEAVLTDSVAGFDVALEGDLIAGADSELTLSVSQDGEPVTTLEPYLGAFGHLVALRDGDFAYMHVHAHGDEPQAGENAGPEIVFTAEAHTEGRYFFYLDFQVDGEVHTAEFVVDTTGLAQTDPTGSSSDAEDDAEHGDDHGH